MDNLSDAEALRLISERANSLCVDLRGQVQHLRMTMERIREHRLRPGSALGSDHLFGRAPYGDDRLHR